MVKKSHSPVQIINKLREVEILLNQGANVGEASRKIGVTEQTYYRWRKEYGGMRIEQAKRLKGLEKENALPVTPIQYNCLSILEGSSLPPSRSEYSHPKTSLEIARAAFLVQYELECVATPVQSYV